jgi:hypothetical protein
MLPPAPLHKTLQQHKHKSRPQNLKTFKPSLLRSCLFPFIPSVSSHRIPISLHLIVVVASATPALTSFEVPLLAPRKQWTVRVLLPSIVLGMAIATHLHPGVRPSWVWASFFSSQDCAHQEAGGVISEYLGRPLDLGLSRTLCRKEVHAQVIEAVQAVLAMYRVRYVSPVLPDRAPRRYR